MRKIIIVEAGPLTPVADGVKRISIDIMYERELPADFYSIEQMAQSTTGLTRLSDAYAEMARRRSVAIRDGMTHWKLISKEPFTWANFLKGAREYEAITERETGVDAFVFDPDRVWLEEGLEPAEGPISGQHAEAMSKYLSLIGMMVPPGENGPVVFAISPKDSKYFYERCVMNPDSANTPLFNLKQSLEQRAYQAGFERKRRR